MDASLEDDEADFAPVSLLLDVALSLPSQLLLLACFSVSSLTISECAVAGVADNDDDDDDDKVVPSDLTFPLLAGLSP